MRSGHSPDPPQYADWSCSWTGSDATPGAWLYFVRDWAPSGGDYGKVIDVAGREASVERIGTSGDDSCLVRVVYRTYNSGREGEASEAKAEQFRLEVMGPGLPIDDLCTRATQLAEIAVGRLS